MMAGVMSRALALRAVGLLAVSSAVLAAEARPRIGLVLSGGGARGAAHVGVLQVLEEYRVPVDVIAGTSMGSIVGGLYAAGMSPQEMEELLASTDWPDVFDDRPDRRRLAFRRKQDDLTFLSRFEVGVRDGRLLLPSGLVAGQKLTFMLKKLTLPVAGVSDFDRLPIPFRAVATDIGNGEVVVLDGGDLADALRASMSVPGVFSPVELGGRLLVDGGLVRNLPTDVAMAMGADVIIAVDVGEPLSSAEDLHSLAGISGQVMSLLTRRNVESSLPLADIVVDPDLEGFTASDFVRSAAMVPRGAAAAREQGEALRRLSVSADEYETFLRRQRRRDMKPPMISSVQVANTSDADSRIVMERVETQPGRPLDLDVLARDLDRLYELGDFETVDFELIPDGDAFILLLDARSKSWGPNYVRFGLNLTSDFEGESAFNVLTSFTMTRLNRLGAEWRTAVQMGETPEVFTELYQPLTWSGALFVSPWAERVVQTVNSYEELRPVSRYQVKHSVIGVDLGVVLGRVGEIRLGAYAGAGRAEPRVGANDLPALDVDVGAWRLQAVVDQLDDPDFPRHGVLGYTTVVASREALGSSTSYDALVSEWVLAASGGRNTVVGLVSLRSALGSELPFYGRFSVGGFFNLSGYPRGSVDGQYGGVASLLYYYRLTRLPGGFVNGLYAGLSAEAGNLWETAGAMSASDLRTAGSLYLAADTAVGPVYLAWGRADVGADAFYLYVGRTF